MSYTVDWITKTIDIPTSDLVLVSGTRYKLVMWDFLVEIRRLEYSDGLWASQILEHTNKQLDFAGSDYAGFDRILNGYTVQFSGLATRVDLVGSNNNIIDNLNATGVSVVPSNSAGLQIVAVGSGLSTEEHDALLGAQANTVDIETKVDSVGVVTNDTSNKVDNVILDLAEIDSDVIIIYDRVEEILQGVVGTLDIIDNGDGTETVKVFDVGETDPDTAVPIFTMTVANKGLRRIRN